MTGPNLPIPGPSRQLLPATVNSCHPLPESPPYVPAHLSKYQLNSPRVPCPLSSRCWPLPHRHAFIHCLLWVPSLPFQRPGPTLSCPSRCPLQPSQFPFPGPGQSFTLSLSLQPLSQAAPCTVPSPPVPTDLPRGRLGVG